MVIFDLEHLEEVNEENLVLGGDGAQFVGSTSGAILGFANGSGSASVTSTSISNLSGVINQFLVTFGTTITGFTSPF